ncbi:N-formylglutamate amidohydrolase [Tateyamaria sp.]|uniref:N-formylglutamate amidohydrolase n=1 Tax=Tateyamaria sp. TaxID=1929288 RepID=UPI00329F0599
MNHMQAATPNTAVTVLNPEGRSSVVLVCEHACNFIPQAYGGLGLDDAARQSHIAWDPGALDVARGLSERLDAKLVMSNVSRLVYDCNRPPMAPDAMPTCSETFDISGNMNLTEEQRRDRVATVYEPFRAGLAAAIAARPDPVIVTLHSFTPVYKGQRRSVEIGVLHDADSRLAAAMMQIAGVHTSANVKINAPYGPEDGVTHTLKEHALKRGHLNVMLEIRSDLIANDADQDAMADSLAGWLADALADLGVKAGLPCHG